MLRQKIKVLTALFITALVVIGILVACIFAGKPYKEVAKSTTAWEIGAFNENGAKVYSSSAIRTKKFYKSADLKIELAEDNTIEYQVIYFDKDKKFIGSSEFVADNATELEITFVEGKSEDDVELVKVQIKPSADYYGEEEVEIKAGVGGNMKGFISQIALKYAKDTAK